MREIATAIYTFDELSNKAKKVAIENEARSNTESRWYHFLLEDWKDRLALAGFLHADIYFSGFCSQGDGACFDATIDLKHWIKDGSFGSLEKYIEWIRADITIINHHYSHSGTRNVDLSFLIESEVWMDASLLVLEKLIDRQRRDLCEEIYQALEAEYNHLTSEDFCVQYFKEDGCEFYEDGTRFYE